MGSKLRVNTDNGRGKNEDAKGECRIMIELLVLIAFVLCLGLFWRRNDNVHEYRMALLKMVSKAAQQDIETGKDWEWRHDEFDSVSYYGMFFKFWRSFDSFYIESPAREERRP